MEFFLSFHMPMQFIYFYFVLAESPAVPEGEATSPVDINFANLRPQYSTLGNTLTTTPSASDESDDAAEEKNDAEENTTNPQT